MHPHPAFDWADRDQMLRLVEEVGFAHIFAASKGALFVVHAPLLVTPAGAIQFHVSRRNRIAEHLPGQSLLISVVGRHAYQSANWYVSDNQVPTWHYESVEIEGVARQLSQDDLVTQLDQLSAKYETRVEPKHPWTREKMDAQKFEAMTKAIIGFEVEPIEIRGTRKFNQHKNAEDLEATIAGQQGAGREDVVTAIREAAGAR